MSVAVRLSSVKCLDEKNEASASEEVYVLVTVADLRPPGHGLPIPSLPNVEVFHTDVLEDMDDDDPPRFVDGPVFWGLNGAPAPITDPAHVAIAVTLMEQDNQGPGIYATLLRAQGVAALAASAGDPDPASRGARFVSAIRDIMAGINEFDVPIPFAFDDDHIGTEQLVLDRADLFPGHRGKQLHIKSGEGDYVLGFETTNTDWNGDWFPLPGQHVFDHQKQRIAAVSRSPGNLDLFTIGLDNKVYTTFWPNNGQWNGDWFPLPGQHIFDHQVQQIAAVARSPQNLDLFVIGFDNKVYTTFWPNNGQWNGDWFPLPGQHIFDHQVQQIAAVARSPQNLDLFVIGFDNKVYTTFWPNNGQWNGDWFPLPGQHIFDHQVQQIAAVARSPQNLDLFVIGFDNKVYTTFWPNNGQWNGDWFPLPGQHIFDHQVQQIAAVARSPQNLDLFVIGFDNKVYTTFWPNNGQWNGDWFPLPGQHIFDHQVQQIAAVARSPQNLDLFVIGFDNKVYTTFWPNNGQWNGDWFPLPGQHIFDHQKQRIAAISQSPGNLDLFTIGFDNKVYTTFWAGG